MNRAAGIVLIAVMFASNQMRGDMSVLGITGPHSGTGFANLGAVTKGTVATTLTNAEVLIEIQGKRGDDLIATCTAVFDLDTDPAPQAAQTLLVAFPVTGLTDEAVKISQFKVTVDGIQMPELKGREIHLFTKDGMGNDRLPDDWLPVEAKSDTLGTLGYRLNGGTPQTTDALMQAYAWPQEFSPGKHSRVEVIYSLTLHPQSLAYAKKFLKRQSHNVVPFDAMWAGKSDQKAYFLDYILRSGTTWKGPIGHEKVVLRVAPTSGITLDLDESFASGVVTFGRHLFEDPEPLLRESLERCQVGVLPDGFRRSDGLVWEISHEEPQEDILVEIPWNAVKTKVSSKTAGR